MKDHMFGRFQSLTFNSAPSVQCWNGLMSCNDESQTSGRFYVQTRPIKNNDLPSRWCHHLEGSGRSLMTTMMTMMTLTIQVCLTWLPFCSTKYWSFALSEWGGEIALLARNSFDFVLTKYETSEPSETTKTGKIFLKFPLIYSVIYHVKEMFEC